LFALRDRWLRWVDVRHHRERAPESADEELAA
jgi:hypothetical protein